MYFSVLEDRQGLKVACPEEVAWKEGYISDKELEIVAKETFKSGYGQYLLRILDKKYR